MMSIILFFLVLSVLVIFHELGHFWAARLFKVKAEEFGVGFPPRATGFVKEGGKWQKVGPRDEKIYKNTIWSLNWLPLGGFVRLKGESGETLAEDSFAAKPHWQRFIILGAGVFMNWWLAVFIFTGGFIAGVPAQTDDLPASAIVTDAKIQIESILPGSAADQAGIEPGMYVKQADGVSVKQVADLQKLIADKGTNALTLLVETGTGTQSITATPAFIKEINRVGLGITMANTGIVRFPWYQAFFQGMVVTWGYTKAILSAFGNLLYELIFKQKLVADVSGPVGIAVMTGKIAAQGIWSLLQFMALLSINLAIVNFLPIPALDGGRALFVIIEAIRHRKIKAEFEANLHKFGFIALMSLVILVTLHDLKTFGPAILISIKTMIGL